MLKYYMTLLNKFRPITLKRLNSLTTIDTFSCLCSPKVTHQTAVREVLGSIPGSGKDFCLISVLLLSQTHYLSRKFAISFAMFIRLVNLTYCKLWDDYKIIKGIKIQTNNL